MGVHSPLGQQFNKLQVGSFPAVQQGAGGQRGYAGHDMRGGGGPDTPNGPGQVMRPMEGYGAEAGQKRNYSVAMHASPGPGMMGRGGGGLPGMGVGGASQGVVQGPYGSSVQVQSAGVPDMSGYGNFGGGGSSAAQYNNNNSLNLDGYLSVNQQPSSQALHMHVGGGQGQAFSQQQQQQQQQSVQQSLSYHAVPGGGGFVAGAASSQDYGAAGSGSGGFGAHSGFGAFGPIGSSYGAVGQGGSTYGAVGQGGSAYGAVGQGGVGVSRGGMGLPQSQYDTYTNYTQY